MLGSRKQGTLELVIRSKVRRRKKEVLLCFFIVVMIVFFAVWKDGGDNMFETKFDIFHPAFISTGSDRNFGSNPILKNKAMLDNHSYSDGSSSLFYHEELLQAEKRPPTPTVHGKDKTKTILVWTQNWNNWNELPNPFGLNRENWFRNFGCPIWQCRVVPWDPSGSELNKSGIPVEDFDAVIFNDFFWNNITDRPTKRSAHQRYVFWSLESPAHASYLKLWDDASAEGFFNWTMTYRWDSDIINPYGYMRRFTDEEIRSGKALKKANYAEGKSKMMCWFVSQCTAVSGRSDYISQLQRYIPVDIYGHCGNLTCEREKQGECRRMMSHDYKFVIAFENSLCWDYVTEKFFYNVNFNVIPIVIDLHGNYARFAPPKSYINALDFPTVKELADYLKVLDGNDTLYNEYFWWKVHYVFEYSLHVYDLNIYERAARGLCGLCSKLHDPAEPTSIYTNLTKWWSHDATCKVLRFPEYPGNDTWIVENFRPQYDARVISGRPIID